MDFAADLSEPQRKAVSHGEGPLLVLAGAGSGKTRVITYRVANLIANLGVAPWRVLAVTFTNKAAGEMRERVARLLGPDAVQVWLGTFHATCARLLRRHPEAVGLKPDFTIYDDDDSNALLSRILKELNVDTNLLAPREAHARIDRAKQDGRGPEGIPRRSSRDELAARVFVEYDLRLRQSNAVDFGDLLVLAVRLLEENEPLREQLRERFLHVLVDEFQDTNRIQFRLVQLLVNDRRNLCVVGDDDQSIYRWRGAEVRNILDFEKHYPGTVTVRLEQNYRSTAHVLAAASAVVKRNTDRHEKELWTANPAGDPVRVVLAGDEREEASAVSRLVETLRAEGTSLSQQAVFYRVNAQSRVLEEALRGRGIPYVVVGGFRFYERSEVKNLLAYLRLLVNPADEASFLRIVNVPPRGIGKVSVERLQDWARSSGKPLLAAAAEAGNVPDLPSGGARALTALARQRKLPTQMNNGGAASPGFRRGVEIVREGLLGEVRQVHIFFSRGGRNFQSPPQGTEEVPKELNWDLWLAQVKWREYHPGWINRIAWRETSIGELGNFGPHSSNMAFMGLCVKDLWEAGAGRGPIRIVAECSEVNQLSYPRWERIRWEIPARGELPPVAFTWHHGYPPDYAEGSRKMLEQILRDHGATEKEFKGLLPDAGCLILGSKGLLATNSHNTEVRLLPKEKFDSVEQKRPLTLPASPGHYKEWIEACRGGPMPFSNFEYAAPFAEFLAVGSLSTRFPGEPIEFDPASGRITNHPRAAEFLRYEYRKGWTI